MMDKKPHRRSWVNVPPWVILGAVFILAPIFLFMTLENIHRQKANTTELLLEKGAALIRSFEAGARTGMMGMRWGGNQVQRLLAETAQQPDIAYLLVTDDKGTILACSDPSMIGRTHGTDLDLKRIAHSQDIEWRRFSSPGGEETFEVFRRFAPTRGGGFQRFRNRMMSNPLNENGMMSNPSNDWCQTHVSPDNPTGYTGQIIFVGLDMGPLETARQEDIHHTLVMGAILLLIGFAGIVSLFLAHAYRATKTSLSRVQAFSDNLVENMPAGLLAIDTEGRMAAFNQTAESLFGKSAYDVVGRQMDQVLPAPVLSIARKIRQHEETIVEEVDCPAGGDGNIPLGVSATWLRGEDGVLMGYLILLRDLRQIKALEQEIKRNERLASLGRLAAGVAHEIRNPLSSIKGFATYFKERYRNVPEDQKTAEIMIQEVERLNRVITQLLELARPMSVQKEVTAVKPLIERSLKMVRAEADAKGIETSVLLDPGIQELNLDQDRINQVLLNLYLNAMEAMPEGGALTVRLAPHDHSEKVEITVTDTGAGINKNDLVHVFDPYFTTKPSGTGLGLAIVHNIVEAHGGEVRVQSEPGKGTSVSIILPR